MSDQLIVNVTSFETLEHMHERGLLPDPAVPAASDTSASQCSQMNVTGIASSNVVRRMQL